MAVETLSDGLQYADISVYEPNLQQVKTVLALLSGGLKEGINAIDEDED